MRRTKIVATLGPASDTAEAIDALLDAGMDVARLGLAHGTPEAQLAVLQRVRDVAQRRGRHIGVLADLPGPKVRVGSFPEGGVDLHEGDMVQLVRGDEPSRAGRIVVDEPQLLDGAGRGETVVLGDGNVTLVVREVGDNEVLAQVQMPGRLQGRPGVHLPASHWQPPVPTDQDLALIEKVACHADWVAVSFVKRAEELAKVRAALGDSPARLIAKIETRTAADNLDELVDAADAVMVARGDLGIELPIEDVPQLQKRIIRLCVARGKPVITATQMLESMTNAPTPTRAEASDVANAVYDGSDALMLSGETAIGHAPALAVRTMARIATRADHSGNTTQGPPWQSSHIDGLHLGGAPVTAAMTRAAAQASSELALDAIICCTRTGHTARAMAARRPRCRLVGASPSAETIRQLALSWGVQPLLTEPSRSTDEVVAHALEACLKAELIRSGATVAVLAGAPESATNSTDVLRIVSVE